MRTGAVWLVFLALAGTTAGCGQRGGRGSTTSSAPIGVQSATTGDEAHAPTPSVELPASTTTAEVSTATTGEVSAQVLAAAAQYRATVSNSFGDEDQFTTLYLVERFGKTDPVEFVTVPENAPSITAAERTAIETALAPRNVTWVHSLDAVIGRTPPLTVPDRHAVIMLTAPTIDGNRAEVGTMLWCGMTCAVSSTLILELTNDGNWVVTDEVGGGMA